MGKEAGGGVHYVFYSKSFSLVHNLLFLLSSLQDSSKVSTSLYFGKLIIPFIFVRPLRCIAQQSVVRSVCPCMAAGELEGCQERGRGANHHWLWRSAFQRGDLPIPIKTHDISEELQDLSASFLTQKSREVQVSPAGKNRLLFIFNGEQCPTTELTPGLVLLPMVKAPEIRIESVWRDPGLQITLLLSWLEKTVQLLWFNKAEFPRFPWPLLKLPWDRLFLLSPDELEGAYTLITVWINH